MLCQGSPLVENSDEPISPGIASQSSSNSEPQSRIYRDIRRKVDFIHGIVMDNSENYWAWTSQTDEKGQKKAIRKIFFDQKMKVKFTEKNIRVL